MRTSTVAPALATRARLHPGALVADLLADVAADEDEQCGGGCISASAYETAWVALVREPQHPNALLFPESLLWLLREQRPDGSWGPQFPYSLVPTLAALLALHRCPWQTEPVGTASARAEQYLRRTLGRWQAEMLDTPFFEFVVPLLAGELAEAGVHLGVPDLELMQRRREEKLTRLPLDLLYTGQSNLVHALEVLGAHLDFSRVKGLQAANGCYGYSPSASAAVLLQGPAWDEPAARWLRQLSARVPGGAPGAMPASHPADTFEAAWVLHVLLHGGVPLHPASSAPLRALLTWLSRSLTPAGASFARLRAMPCDADDTAMALLVLNRLGVHTRLNSLWSFEKEAHFVSYVGERISSSSANAHVLEALMAVDALGHAPELAARSAKLVRFLLDTRAPEGCWQDKWHLSPYYATMSCVLALAGVPDPMLHRELVPTLAWLRETQGRGGWGFQQATVEETAYALLAVHAMLRAVPEAACAGDREVVRRGQAFLLRHLGDVDDPTTLPTLWVDKTLYAPPRVIRAAVLAALHACPLTIEALRRG